MNSGGRIKVLVVDDSAIVRKVLKDTLDAEPDLEVIATAPDAFIARKKILALEPDVLTLDIEMPGMDGLTFLRQIMQERPMPVVVLSSLARSGCEIAVEALRLGAVDVVPKPGGPYSVADVRVQILEKIRAAAAARIVVRAAAASSPPQATPAGEGDQTTVIAIGASTGGTEALCEVLSGLPAWSPGIVVAQHIPPGFSTAFAKRLNRLCTLEVKEADDGDRLGPGQVLIAPGKRHIVLRGGPGAYHVSVKNGPPVNYHTPSVDVLFASVAESAGPHAIGLILTGMGADGARGLLRMKLAGAHTIAQNQDTCVVFGMPREAIRLGAAHEVLPLGRCARALVACFRPPAEGSAANPRSQS